MHHTLMVCLLMAAAATPLFAQPPVFVVRHAERADAGTRGSAMMADDPDLSGAGKLRAEALARALRDAGVTAIFTTELRRTRQTAAPLATARGVTPQTLPAKDVAGLVARLKTSTGPTLVVGHSNTIPDILKGLGVPDPVTVGEHDFDHLFVVVRGTLVRLRYGGRAD